MKQTIIIGGQVAITLDERDNNVEDLQFMPDDELTPVLEQRMDGYSSCATERSTTCLTGHASGLTQRCCARLLTDACRQPETRPSS